MGKWRTVPVPQSVRALVLLNIQVRVGGACLSTDGAAATRASQLTLSCWLPSYGREAGGLQPLLATRHADLHMHTHTDTRRALFAASAAQPPLFAAQPPLPAGPRRAMAVGATLWAWVTARC